MQIPLRPVDGIRITSLIDNSPDVLVPAHCTSWVAMQTFVRDLPEAFRPNAVGSRFEFEAAA